MTQQLVLDSPVGKLLLTSQNGKLSGLVFYRGQIQHSQKSTCPILSLASKELNLYFSGRLKKFSVPLDLTGTDFQLKAWKALAKIPYGKTISYSDQAKLLGSESAVRAIGSANGKNPICIIVPCHRVIAKDGSPGGYSGGLKIKKFLLELESGY